MNEDTTDRDILPLLGSVHVKPVSENRITKVTLALFAPDANERWHTDEQAWQDVQSIKAVSGRFVLNDTIQPMTWDFGPFAPPEHHYTPAVLIITIQEKWLAKEKRRGVDRLIPYERLTGLSIYETNRPYYEARQWQGDVEFRPSYHKNSIQIERAAVFDLIKALGFDYETA
jgi:hypothetical protein